MVVENKNRERFNIPDDKDDKLLFCACDYLSETPFSEFEGNPGEFTSKVLAEHTEPIFPTVNEVSTLNSLTLLAGYSYFGMEFLEKFLKDSDDEKVEETIADILGILQRLFASNDSENVSNNE